MMQTIFEEKSAVHNQESVACVPIYAKKLPHCPRKQLGFTLLEMLVVIFLIATVSTVGLFSYEGAQDESQVSVTKFEMLELKKALLQFRNDTGAFPCGVYTENTRPYQLDVTVTGSIKSMKILANMAPTLTGAAFPAPTATEATSQTWCKTEGLKMLMKFPYDEWDTVNSYTETVEAAHPLWLPDVAHGWHGPYLSSKDALKDAWGNPYLLLSPELDYTTPSKKCDMVAANPTFTQCRAIGEAGASHKTLGNIARIASAGPDGRYGSGNENGLYANEATGDNINPCDQVPAEATDIYGRDDIVVCLLQ